MFTEEELEMSFMSYLKSALISNIGLEAIYIDYEIFSVRNMIDFIEILDNNKVIKDIYFIDSSSTNTVILKIAELIRRNNSLKSIDLSINWKKTELGQEFDELYNSLFENKYLECLNLSLGFEKSKKEGNKFRTKVKIKELDYNFRLSRNEEFRYLIVFDWKKKFNKGYLD